MLCDRSDSSYVSFCDDESSSGRVCEIPADQRDQVFELSYLHIPYFKTREKLLSLSLRLPGLVHQQNLPYHGHTTFASYQSDVLVFSFSLSQRCIHWGQLTNQTRLHGASICFSPNCHAQRACLHGRLTHQHDAGVRSAITNSQCVEY